MNIIRDLYLKLKKDLLSDQILLIIGARQVGKTFLLHQIKDRLKSPYYFLNLEDPEYLSLLNKSPKNLFKIFPFDLKKRTFLFIDEIQYLKNPSNFLKYFYDQYKDKIKIIATGSSSFYLDRKFKDSLVGRKKIFNLFTLSFREFLRFKKEQELSQKDFYSLTLSEKEKIILYYKEYLVFGGYPRVVLTPISEKEEILKDIAYSYIKKDIFEANIQQEGVFYRLLKILASQTGSLVNTSELADTLKTSRSAIKDYLYLMQKSFHIRLINPFFRNLRKEITKMPKVYFLDLGLRNFLIRNFKPFEQREDRGEILENALFRELLKSYDLDDIRFWRTIYKQEIDFVVKDFAYEAKLNPERFKKKRLESFFKHYPNITLSLVTFDYSKDRKDGIPITEVWKI